MCCGVPEDMYDLVNVVTDARDVANAFAAAFEAREEQQHVSVVLPRTERGRRARRCCVTPSSGPRWASSSGTPSRTLRATRTT